MWRVFIVSYRCQVRAEDRSARRASNNRSDTSLVPVVGAVAGPHRKERRFTGHAMADTADTANVIVQPPIAWALAVLAGLALNWLMPLPFVPAAVPAGWLGTIVFALALALVAWAISTMTRAGSNVPTSLPTTTIVETGPYRFTRNPIYLGMVLGLIGLAIAFNSLWLLMTLVPFALVIRYGVISREEAYLERKFSDVYRGYRSRVRRWL